MVKMKYLVYVEAEDRTLVAYGQLVTAACREGAMLWVSRVGLIPVHAFPVKE